MDPGQIAEISAELTAEAARRAALARSPLIERLAVVATFDRDQFVADEDYADVERLLCVPVRARGHGTAFILAEGPRVAALAEMLRRGGTGELARIRQELGLLPQAPLQQALDAFVLSEPWPLAERDEDGLVASLDVWRWATEAIALAGLSQQYEVTPDRDLIESRLSVLDLTRAVRKLLSGGFVGRKAEMTLLRDYCLGKAAGSGLSDPPMLVYGIGGVGKSTLIARFVMDLVSAPDSASATAWAYLDLDRPTLSSFEPMVLLRDITRQLAAQFPKGRRVLQRSQLVSQQSAMGSGLESADTATSFRAAVLDLALALRELRCSRLVVVLDTFEEAERRGQPACDQIYELFAALASHPFELRLVVSGRGPARVFARAGRPGRQLDLAPFRGKEAVALLRHLALREADLARVPPPSFDDALAREVVRLVGGIPLTLRLAARVLVHEGPVVDAVVRVRALDRVRAEFVQGFLYQRVLNHLVGADPALGDALPQVARASLVLRRVTPELVGEVLLPSLHPAPDVPVADLYQALASEVALAEETDGVLRLRPELRGPALAALTYDDPQLVARIHARASAYYARIAQSGPGARAELAYHRLAAGEPAAALGDLLDDTVLASLEQSLEDLPAAAARTVQEARRDVTTLAAERDRADWELSVQTAVETALRSGRLAEARRLLGEKSGRSQFSLLYRLESRLYEAEGNLGAAVRSAELDRTAAAAAADPTRFAASAIRVAALEERGGRFEQAVQALRDAEAHPLLGGYPAIRLELLLNRMNTGERGAMTDEDTRWSLELDARSLIQRTSPQEVTASSALSRLLAAALGEGEPERIRVAARAVGLGQDEDPVRVERLVEAIARWDAGQPQPGRLALAAGMRTDGDDPAALHAAWRSALAGLGTEASPVLERLWSTQPPPAQVLAALRDIYLWWGVARPAAPAEPSGAVPGSDLPGWSRGHLLELEEQLLAAYPSPTHLVRLMSLAGLDAAAVAVSTRLRDQVRAMLTEASHAGKLLDLAQAVLDDSSATAVHPAVWSLIQRVFGGARLRLRLHHTVGGRHRVALNLDGGGAPMTAVAEFGFESPSADTERLRWYIEDYPAGPADQVTAIVAERTRRQMAEQGRALFTAVFDTDPRAREIWASIGPCLATVRIEVSGIADAAPLPWELMRDPRTDQPLVLQVNSFVRASGGPVFPGPSPDGVTDGLRVLLVICRPMVTRDVPFRSVARQLTLLKEQAQDLLHLDVLRPPTFARLGEVLAAARAAGRPYHLVHFDGPGIYLDARGPWPLPDTLLRPAWAGPRGYVLFEDPDQPSNMRLVDGSALGGLLAGNGVSVLVLNASRSGYAEAPSGTSGAAAEDEAGPARDSFAGEAVSAGLAGVVAMRYDVYVQVAAQFVADLYTELLDGLSLGTAVTAGRRQLAAQPNRAAGGGPLASQDWLIPVVYEAAPLVLFRPATRAGLPRLLIDDGSAEHPVAGLPRPPDAGFFGCDETLLALDRAYDQNRIVMLHGDAGGGKTATAVEFARWYLATGGLAVPDQGQDLTVVLFSSLTQYRPLPRLLNDIAGAFDQQLDASGISWLALTDPAQRYRVIMQVLQAVPVLWIWDAVEAAEGSSAATDSPWSPADRQELGAFLQDVSVTKARLLLTSRRAAGPDWLGELPVRLALPPLPMREAFQLTQAVAVRHDRPVGDGADWRPLLRFAAGNPLAVTLLTSQALREGLTSSAQIEEFANQLRSGASGLDDNLFQGLSRPLTVTFDHILDATFSDAERSQLTVLRLFQGTVDVEAFVFMGDPENPGRLTELAALDRESGTALLDRAAKIGVLTALGGGTYTIPPALTSYLNWRTAGAGQASPDGARRAEAAYAAAIARLGRQYAQAHNKSPRQAADLLQLAEADLLHVRMLAVRTGNWDEALACMQGLKIVYEESGSLAEWARLVEELVPGLTDPVTGGPYPGRAEQWRLLTSYRVQIAAHARDWAAAERVLMDRLGYTRALLADVLARPADVLTGDERDRIRELAADEVDLGDLLRAQQRPDCVPPYQVALDLLRQVGARQEEAAVELRLGGAYLSIPELRDLDHAEDWLRRSLALTDESDRSTLAAATMQLAQVAYERFQDASAIGETGPVLSRYLDNAATEYLQALQILPADAISDHAFAHRQLGMLYNRRGSLDTAAVHYQRSIEYAEAAGNQYDAGQTRLAFALILAEHGKRDEALLYANAAVRDLEPYRHADAASSLAQARNLISQLG